jgi:hypothetical protein
MVSLSYNGPKACLCSHYNFVAEVAQCRQEGFQIQLKFDSKVQDIVDEANVENTRMFFKFSVLSCLRLCFSADQACVRNRRLFWLCKFLVGMSVCPLFWYTHSFLEKVNLTQRSSTSALLGHFPVSHILCCETLFLISIY